MTRSETIGVPVKGVPPRAPRWLPDLVFTGFLIAVAFAPPPIEGYVSANAGVVALTLLPILLLPLRRLVPMLTLVALILLFALVVLQGTLSFGVGFAVAVAVFHIASRSPRRRAMMVGGCAAVLMVLVSLFVREESVFDPRVLQFGFVVAFATAAGMGKRTHQAYIAAITERAE